MEIRVSDYIAQHLGKIGVRAAFLLSGGGMMHLIDAVSRIPEIDYICNHHEQCCAIAAEAYARRTGSLGVCYATSGPGATNLLTGIVGAWQDSAPVLFLTGQSKLSQTIQGSNIDGLRQFGTFEVDIVPIVKSVTKYAVMLKDPTTARWHLEKAIHAATTGRPGPVLIDVPLDIQAALIDPDTLEGYVPEKASGDDRSRLDAEAASILDQLQSARRPVILAGHGVRTAGAAEHFRSLIARLNVPVVTTQLAKDLLPYADPLFVGHCGPRGDRAGNFAIQTADLILTLGCSLHVMTTGYELDEFAPNARKILVDPDPAILAREEVGCALKIEADIFEFIAAAADVEFSAPLVSDGKWQATTRDWKGRFAVIDEPHISDPSRPSNYYHITHALSAALRDDDTLVTDAGSAFYVVGQGFLARRQQRVIISGALGAMGYSLPAAIGVCAAQKGTGNPRAIVLTGDGSLQLNIHELATIRHNALPVKLFVVNNGGYLSIRNTQKGFFSGHAVGSGEDSGVWCPPLAKIAEAYDLLYIACRTRSELEDCIERTLSAEGPVICEIFADLAQALMPAVPAFRLPNGSMKSKQLHEMNPPLSAEETAAIMAIAIPGEQAEFEPVE